MIDYIIIAIIIIAVIIAVTSIVRAKRSGRACMGCPNAGTCGKQKCDCDKLKN